MISLTRLPFLLLLCALPLAATLAQPLRFSISEELAQTPGLKAVLVSNQYGVLRYYHPWQANQERKALSFEVNQRLGESLSLTTIREVEENGLYRFLNTTYCQLADGAVIGAPDTGQDAIQPGSYQNIELIIAGVSTVEDVLVLSPIQGWPEYRIDRQGLVISFRASEADDLSVILKINGWDNYQAYYGPPGNRRRIETDTSQLVPNVATAVIALPAKYFWDGSVKAFPGGGKRPYYAFNSTQPKATEPYDTIRVFLPALAWEHFELDISNQSSAVFRYQNRFREKLPAALETFDFNPLLDDSQSKAFRFKTEAAEAGQFYAITYAYSLYGEKDASWQIWGQVGQAGEVDFILPDLPDDLLQALPELRALSKPTAVRKSMSRCIDCQGYDFRKAPAALQKREWRLEKGLISQEQELEF